MIHTVLLQTRNLIIYYQMRQVQSLQPINDINYLAMFHCIDYDDYKKIADKNSLSPRKNLFQENRIMATQIDALTKDNEDLHDRLQKCQDVCFSIIDAIARVYSQEVAEELIRIVKDCEGCQGSMGSTIYELMVLHQSQPNVSDWSQSNARTLRTPEKSDILCDSWAENHNVSRLSHLSKEDAFGFHSVRKRSASRSPLSSIHQQSFENSKSHADRSTSRSSNKHSAIIASGLTCEICEEIFSPNEFIEHASLCREPSFAFNSNQDSFETLNLQDTQDRKLKMQSDSHLVMMKNLLRIREEIEQQMKLLQFSKEKIDREALKRKLQKDLAKVNSVIQEKKKKCKAQKTTGKNKKKLLNSSKLRT